MVREHWKCPSDQISDSRRSYITNDVIQCVSCSYQWTTLRRPTLKQDIVKPKKLDICVTVSQLNKGIQIRCSWDTIIGSELLLHFSVCTTDRDGVKERDTILTSDLQAVLNIIKHCSEFCIGVLKLYLRKVLQKEHISSKQWDSTDRSYLVWGISASISIPVFPWLQSGELLFSCITSPTLSKFTSILIFTVIIIFIIAIIFIAQSSSWWISLSMRSV